MSEWLRYLALASLAVYFLFDFLDGKRVRDEREELIRLKSLEFAHKANMGTLTLLAFLYVLKPGLEVPYVILASIAAALYGEIGAKVFYRWQL